MRCRAVGAGINRIMRAPDKGVLLITHYQRLLDYVTPDKVHVLRAGRIVRIGRPRTRARARARRLCGDGGVMAFAIVIACIAFMIVVASVRGNPGRAIADTALFVILLGVITVVDFIVSRFADTVTRRKSSPSPLRQG